MGLCWRGRGGEGGREGGREGRERERERESANEHITYTAVCTEIHVHVEVQVHVYTYIGSFRSCLLDGFLQRPHKEEWVHGSVSPLKVFCEMLQSISGIGAGLGNWVDT